jgi:membrane protein DedA with SNARE-associated domain
VIFGLLTFDVFLPVPSSIVSTAAGAMLGFWKGTGVIWLGMSAGCLIGYATGWRTAAAARRFVGEESLARAADVMDRYGPWALVACRPVPVLAEASTVFAGIVRARFVPFLALTTLSNLGISAMYAAVGAYTMQIQSFLLTFVAALALPGVAMAAARLWLGGRVRTSER